MTSSGRNPTSDRALRQRCDALQSARQQRAARAVLRSQIASGDITLLQVVTDPPQVAQRMTVHSLLIAQRGTGPIRASQYLAQARIEPHRTLGKLTPRQRNQLLSELRTSRIRKERLVTLSERQSQGGNQ